MSTQTATRKGTMLRSVVQFVTSSEAKANTKKHQNGSSNVNLTKRFICIEYDFDAYKCLHGADANELRSLMILSKRRLDIDSKIIKADEPSEATIKKFFDAVKPIMLVDSSKARPKAESFEAVWKVRLDPKKSAKENFRDAFEAVTGWRRPVTDRSTPPEVRIERETDKAIEAGNLDSVFEAMASMRAKLRAAGLSEEQIDAKMKS